VGHEVPKTGLVLLHKQRVANGIVELTFSRPSRASLPSWDPGAHIDLTMPNGMTRQYSLCGAPNRQSTWTIAVRRDPQGRGGSIYLHDLLETGQHISAAGPRNSFVLEPAPEYLFIAGGIGITPILPMLAAASARDAAWSLIYSGQSRSSMAYLDRVEAHASHVVVHPKDVKGRLNLDAAIGRAGPESVIYCCGPERMLDGVQRHCREQGRTCRVERFQPPSPNGAVHGFDIQLKQSGLTLAVPPDRSILDVVENAGVQILSSCRSGTCGTCEVAVIDGVPDHKDDVLTADERRSNATVMTCVSRSLTPRLVLDL